MVTVAVAVGGTGVCRARLSTQPAAARSTSGNINAKQPTRKTIAFTCDGYRTALIWRPLVYCQAAATG